MTLDQQIAAAITKCEEYMFTIADKFLYEVTLGEKPCGELKLFMLGQWMLILKEYRIYHFNDNGSAIAPDYECLSQSEILELIGKINGLSC